MKLLKFYSTSCGTCGRMSHYDNKVATELGLEFKSYKANTEAFNSNSHLLDIVREERGRVGFPVYVVTDDDGNYKGNVMGGHEKGKFREALKQVLNGATTFDDAPTPGGPDCPYYTLKCTCYCTSGDGEVSYDGYVPYIDRSLGEYEIGDLEQIGEYEASECIESKCNEIDFDGKLTRDEYTSCECDDTSDCELVCYKKPDDPDPDPDPGPDPPPPVDPCEGVTCPPCHECRDGVCVDVCGDVDECVPQGTVMGAGDFIDTMELVGSDGHKVTYTRKNVLEETPIGGSIPGLHAGVVYQYTLKSDCGLANNGEVNKDCQIDHRISMGGRRLEMEDMMLSSESPSWDDLILTLDVGYGTFAKSSSTTGTLTIPEICGEEDPCEDVKCPECHECVNGDCVNLCPDGICDDGECVDIPPTFPGNCNDSGNGNDCPTSLISFYYRDNKYGIVYDNEKIQTVWITGAGNPEEATIWIRFKSNTCKVDCDSFCLPKQPQSAAGGYIFDADIECEVVDDTLVKIQVQGKLFNLNPPGIVEGYFVPSSLSYECCFKDCEDIGQIPPYEEGDNGDCNNRPDPNPVPDADKRNKVYLYDRLNHTYVFCCPIRADVTWLLPFDTLPPVFQRYITTSASVRAAAQLIDNPQLFQLLKDREQMLRMECQNYELEQGDLNYLNQPDHTEYYSYQVIQTLNR